MISEQEVQRIAKLARLELAEKEIKKMQKDLSEILDYFNVLKSAPAPLNQGCGGAKKVNIFRIDEPRKSRISDKIVASAPDKKDAYIKVKSIL